MTPKQPAILVFVAHSDDQVLGTGGTIAVYAKKGYRVETIICSFGEFSHPHLKPVVIRKTRVQEAKKADTILGGSGVSFLGLKEGKFGDLDAKRMENLAKRIKELQPEKIFTHDIKDTHPDHKGAAKILFDAVKKSKIKTEIYTFALYRPLKNSARICIDISDTFSLKIQALHAFKSQIAFFTHTWMNNFVYASIYFRAIYAGVKYGVRYAELFNKK